jgi:DNA-directed RNA polymerase specialized sigma24 family protein
MEVLLNLLRVEDREVLESIYFRHEAIEAYATRHGIARSAADMRLSRARRKLAEKMADWADVVR